MNYRYISAILFCSFLFSSIMEAKEPPAGQIGLAPSIFEELRIGNKPVNETVRFINFKEEPVTVQVSVHNWTLDENNKIKLLPPDPQSLDQWITINPLTFTVPPKTSRPIRFSIRPRVQPAPGEHRAIIYFTEKPATNDTTKHKTIKTRFRVGIGIYATAGDVTKQAALHSFRLDGNKLYADIENTGNVHVRLHGKFVVWNEKEFPGANNPGKLFPRNKENMEPKGLAGKGRLNRFPILPGTRRTIATALPRIEKSGTYIIAVKDTLADMPMVHTFKFKK